MLTERLCEVRNCRVLSLGSGPAIEALDCLRGGANFLIDLVDIDESALSRVYDEASKMGKATQVNTHRINVNKLDSNNRTPGYNYDLIYSAGLMDYLSDSQCLRLLDWCFDHLVSDGELILGNFKPKHDDKQMFDTVLDWPLVLRSEADLESLHFRSRLVDREFDVISGDGNAQLFMRSRAQRKMTS